jgi:5-methylcytosine-specific restriction endonuclease McrA
MSEKLCDYGCGQLAKYKFKNGKVCCSANSCSCPNEKQKNSMRCLNKDKPEIFENPENLLCDYGCGEIAKFQFKNGRICCSNHIGKCKTERDKTSEASIGMKHPKPILIENDEGILCMNGCGQLAKYKFKNGNFYCSSHKNKCPINGKKISERITGYVYDKADSFENPENLLCDYGCGEIAKFQLKNGKICCGSHYMNCPVNSKIISDSTSGVKKSKPKSFENLDEILCDLGCGQIAKFKFRTGTLCCEDNISKCPAEIERRTGLKMPVYEKIENLDEILCDYDCGEIAKYQTKDGKYCCSDHLRKCKKIKEKTGKTNTVTFEEALERYPDVFLVEGLIKGSNGEILAHCKNASCSKSVENGDYFEVTIGQVWARNKGINSTLDSANFYCSDKCKRSCILYYRSASDLENLTRLRNSNKLYTDSEYYVWRKEVFTRQLRNNLDHDINFCEICHKTKKLVGHHILPQKLYPEFALDPDNGIVLCSKCHIKYGHTKGTECSTRYLANKVCK